MEEKKTSKKDVPVVDKIPADTKESKDWKSKFFEMDLLSPIYIFLFIILFQNGKDGADLHDAIIHFILTYNN